jgi:two-component system sensor histidine kinase TctE
LLGKVLDWLLAPLFLLWPVSVSITYVVAQNIASIPYDEALARYLQVLEQRLVVQGNQVVWDRGDRALDDLLRAHEVDGVFWMVLGAQGQYLAGDRQLLLALSEHLNIPVGPVHTTDATLGGTNVRLAYKRINLGRGQSHSATVVVAETTKRRAELTREIIQGVIIPQFIALPMAVLLVWLGLSRGIAPLNAMRHRIRPRATDNLSPLDEQAVPTEITPLVRAMNGLLSRQAQAIEAQRRFVADAAHQLKTPLAGLRTQAELALRDASPKEMQASLRQLMVGFDRAARLVNQLLQLSNAEPPPAIGMSEIDLNAVTYEHTTQWAPRALAMGIDIRFEGSKRAVTIAGHALLLGELINNLLDNALRFTPTTGHVTVRVLRLPNGGAQLDIEDSGPGIAPCERERERERVFDRFYRAPGSRADGSGLGLAIVREIADKHGARAQILDPAQPIVTRVPDGPYGPQTLSASAHLSPEHLRTAGTLVRISFNPVTVRPDNSY